MPELTRVATRDGHRVVHLRCYDHIDGRTIVEAHVMPLGGAQPTARGPYVFASAPEAFRFVQEAVLALQYLGCDVS